MSILTTMTDDKKYYMMGWNVVQSTHDKYLKAVKKLIEWYDSEWDDDDPITIDQFDIMVLQYIHWCYEHGKPKWHAETAVHGIKHFMPQLKDCFHRSSQALTGWNKRTPSHSHPPISYEMTLVLAYQMCRSGYVEYGLGVLLSFDCLLRISELCNLQKKHVYDSKHSSSSEYKGMVIIIPHTKNGDNQHVRIHDQSIQELIRLCCRKKKRDDYVFSFTTSQYRRVFKRFINNLGLDKRYVPHSLRHGGATRFHHVLDWSVETVLQRGRWQSINSARLYIQSGKAILLVDEIPESYIQLGQQISKDILLYFRRYLPQ